MINFITTPYKMSDLNILKKAGAHSVIISVPFFSARGVTVFEEKELNDIKTECETLGLNMYVNVNRFFTENELDELRRFLKLLKEINVDGIYFTDMGVYYEAKVLEIENKLIYNPDTLITNSFDANFYLRQNMKAVCLAKEITFDEIVEIGNMSEGNKLEVFIHGRANMMHSKRNLCTNYMHFIGSEHEVRNKTGLYLCEENRDEHMPIMEDELGTHIFSGFTLASFEEINDYIKTGICNFRLDGIFHTTDEIVKWLNDYHLVIENDNGREMFKIYQSEFVNDNYTKGFLYKKTSVSK